MSTDALHARGRTLEELFFAERERSELEALRAQRAKEVAAAGLAAATGIDNESVLASLVDNGVTTETLVAFSIVPLLHVAWADRRLEPAERDALLTEALASGITRDSGAYSLLEGWLGRDPDVTLFPAWKEYNDAMASHLSDTDHAVLKTSVLEKARRIARASGGFLGLGSVSRAESEAIAELERLLS